MKYWYPVIGQREDGSAIMGEPRPINNRNSRKRRRDKIDFRYTVLLDKEIYNKLKTEK